MNSTLSVSAIAFIGRSGSGKTTLLEKLVAELSARGYRVGVVKHTRHRGVETDLPGTDTRRFWEIGAAHTTLVTPDRVVHTHRWDSEPPLDQVLGEIHGLDLILVEGYKHGTLPKIEVVREACDPSLLPEIEGRIACVTDVECLACGPLPRFALEQVVGLADFIEKYLISGRALDDLSDIEGGMRS
ncbi:MAG: molybdopterin-guanine dinucleotide biosynthesis protein B [Anaerolineae bacterium]